MRAYIAVFLFLIASSVPCLAAESMPQGDENSLVEVASADQIVVRGVSGTREVELDVSIRPLKCPSGEGRHIDTLKERLRDALLEMDVRGRKGPELMHYVRSMVPSVAGEGGCQAGEVLIRGLSIRIGRSPAP